MIMSILMLIITIWITGTLSVAAMALVAWAVIKAMPLDAPDGSSSKAAKLVLLSWAWPLMVLYTLVLVVKDAFGWLDS